MCVLWLVSPVPASSRVNPLLHCTNLGASGDPVGAGLPAKRPAQAATGSSHVADGEFFGQMIDQRPHRWQQPPP
ncbi:hypothetical protein CXG45_15260 [Pseudomonas plecoglossicida]|uniref:Secreted protein n=1 Tax=Pseudomonas plecoglossicida TaxID=70775 RepID=A0ABX4U0E2_PSEDL|nr:hypothetical protein CXG44_13380 [Pseudomonas plecoglossicida]PLU92276.1 hypothetical protein CXG45_15260 [Pseudomonas plecoglossicida]PLV01572.1 hypothetical protein CXG48_19555 [Pseudomonas plecoglossicida]PLV13014.1 hypothetical protein CXG47_18185 [Pseudomonas plecoglossicida]